MEAICRTMVSFARFGFVPLKEPHTTGGEPIDVVFNHDIVGDRGRRGRTSG